MAAVFLIDRPRADRHDQDRLSRRRLRCRRTRRVLPMKYTNAQAAEDAAAGAARGTAADRSSGPPPGADRSRRRARRRSSTSAARSALTDAAMDAVRTWTAEPARLNGAPIVTPVTLQVKFGGSKRAQLPRIAGRFRRRPEVNIIAFTLTVLVAVAALRNRRPVVAARRRPQDRGHPRQQPRGRPRRVHPRLVQLGRRGAAPAR